MSFIETLGELIAAVTNTGQCATPSVSIRRQKLNEDELNSAIKLLSDCWLTHFAPQLDCVPIIIQLCALTEKLVGIQKHQSDTEWLANWCAKYVVPDLIQSYKTQGMAYKVLCCLCLGHCYTMIAESSIKNKAAESV